MQYKGAFTKAYLKNIIGNCYQGSLSRAKQHFLRSERPHYPGQRNLTRNLPVASPLIVRAK